VFATTVEMMPTVPPETPGVEIWVINEFAKAPSVLTLARPTMTVKPMKIVTTTVVAQPAPVMLIALPTTDLLLLDPTLFVPVDVASTLTSVKPTPKIMPTVLSTLTETTVKPMELAELVLPTLTAEFSMEDRPLDNLDAKMMELADLASSTPIALLPFLTAVLMEAAMLALLLEKPVVPLMVVKILTNKIAILSPTFV
jgi:hypothetical protein